MDIRTIIDETGRLMARRMPPDVAVISLTGINARIDGARTDLPENLRPSFDQMVPRVRSMLTTIEGLLPSPADEEEIPSEPPEPEPELLDLATREVLSSPRLLNNFIDQLVGRIEASVQVAAKGFAIDPETKAGQLLLALIFADGKHFLSFDHKRQWLAVRRRFADLSEEAQQAVATLGLDRDTTRVVKLNQHFGRILGVTEPDSEPSTEERPQGNLDEAMGDFLDLMSQLIGLANLAWPGGGKEAGERRTQLLGPYLEMVLEAVADASDRAKKRKKTS